MDFRESQQRVDEMATESDVATKDDSKRRDVPYPLVIDMSRDALLTEFEIGRAHV